MEARGMLDVKETIDAVTELLLKFAKSGPDQPRQAESVKAQISKAVICAVPSPADATENYKRICKDFFDRVILAKGMPTRAIRGLDVSPKEIMSSSGQQIAEKLDGLLPQIMERYTWCINNYRIQAENYFEAQYSQLSALISDFLNEVPPTAKERTSKISLIKREIRVLAKWNQQFYAYKARSFPAEIEYVLALENSPIAATWDYSRLDEQGEYAMTYDHKDRDERVYAVRGNWAIAKGLMSVGPDGYIDDIDHPSQEVGCMCSLVWVYALRDLPANMVTDYGRSELKRVRTNIQPKAKSEQTKPKKNWFQNLLGR
jgi:hypothetical protein